MQPELAPRPRSFTAAQVSNSEAPNTVLRDHPEHILPPPPSYRAATENMSQRQTPPSPQDQATSPNNNLLSDHSDGDMGPTDGRKGYGKRELSTSKRAAQNRAAQRAFRQRKEGYIKKLEEQVRDYQVLSENFKAVQAENYQLRDYIINLQSRLLESQHEVPPPPSNVDGLQPGKPNHPSQTPTLPRIAEMGNIGQVPDSKPDVRPPPKPEPSSFYEPSSKRLKTSEMTPAQAALQGTSILGTTSPVSR